MYGTYCIYLYLSPYGDKVHEIKDFTISFTAVPPTPKTCLVQMSHQYLMNERMNGFSPTKNRDNIFKIIKKESNFGKQTRFHIFEHMDQTKVTFICTCQLSKQINSFFFSLSWPELGFCHLPPKNSDLHPGGTYSQWQKLIIQSLSSVSTHIFLKQIRTSFEHNGLDLFHLAPANNLTWLGSMPSTWI